MVATADQEMVRERNEENVLVKKIACIASVSMGFGSKELLCKTWSE